MLRKWGGGGAGGPSCVVQRSPVQPLMQAASGRVLACEGSAWIKGGCRTESHLPRLRYHCLTTGRRVSDTRATVTPRVRQGHGAGPALEVGRQEAHSLPDGDASLDLSRRTKSSDCRTLSKTIGSASRRPQKAGEGQREQGSQLGPDPGSWTGGEGCGRACLWEDCVTPVGTVAASSVTVSGVMLALPTVENVHVLRKGKSLSAV